MNSNESFRHVGVDMLAAKHALALHELAADPAVAEFVRLVYPQLVDEAGEFIERCVRERANGEAYVHTVSDRTTVMGMCGLHEVAPRQSAELRFWVGRPFWGKGLATFAVGNTLDFAFGPLRLEHVICRVLESAPAARHVLEKHGFCHVRPDPGSPAGTTPAVSLALYDVTREQYFGLKYAPFLRDLSAELKPILEAELAAGNEIGECTRGWPEKESVIVALRKPFRPRSGSLPPNVTYREVNDTHWWKAEYALKKPVHLLTCGF